MEHGISKLRVKGHNREGISTGSQPGFQVIDLKISADNLFFSKAKSKFIRIYSNQREHHLERILAMSQKGKAK